MMDIRTLRHVVTIRQCGSFSKAAEVLGVSQPSLSQSIARLEDQLSLKIFVRTTHGSALTPIGELIADRAEHVIAEVRDLARDASLMAGGASGIVRIGCTTALHNKLLNPLVSWIVEHHPNLAIHAELARGDRLLPLLGAREIDIVFTSQVPAEAAAGGMVVQPILEAPAVFVSSPGHPLATERRISANRLAEFKCAGSHSPQSSDTKFLAADNRNFGMYTATHYETLLPMALAGHAILLAPSFVVQDYVEANTLVVLDVDWRATIKFNMITTYAGSVSPVVRCIGEHARQICENLDGEWREAWRPSQLAVGQ